MQRILDALTPDRRRRLYGILIAILAILTGRGLVTAEDAAQVVLALGYALGVGGLTVARKNINTQ